MNAIHRLIGIGGDQLVPELIGCSLEGADDAHDRHYAELKADMRPFEGAGALLRRIHETGLVVVLASSASEHDLEEMRKALGADDSIDAAITADDVARSKPDPAIFETARDTGNVDPALALAVGDTVWDVRAATAAGMGCVCVESGGTSRHELTEVGALAVYRDVEELGNQLFTSPIGALAARSVASRTRPSPASRVIDRPQRRARPSS